MIAFLNQFADRLAQIQIILRRDEEELTCLGNIFPEVDRV